MVSPSDIKSDQVVLLPVENDAFRLGSKDRSRGVNCCRCSTVTSASQLECSPSHCKEGMAYLRKQV